MPQVESSKTKKVPMVQMRDKVGGTFTGTLLGVQDGKGKAAGKKFYEFNVVSGDVKFVLNAGDKTYVSIDVSVGDRVQLLGSADLNDKLGQCPIGSKVTIKYAGKLDLTGGRTMHKYEVRYD